MFTSASNVKPKMREKIMKQYKMILVALLGLVLTACYNKFEMPEAPVIYTTESFEAVNPGIKHIDILELKNKIYGDIENSGSTNTLKDSRDETRYVHFVADPQKECTPWEIENGWYNTENLYIKGKVISNDEEGNIYKSLHIFDGTAAIELKLTNGLFMDYPCNLDTKESMWVYVKLRGLYLGNFRMMLSIGDIPTSSYNSWGSPKFYSNSNILSTTKVRQHVFKGEKTTLKEGTSDDSDIYVVDKDSYSKLFKNKDYLGRLIRFTGLRVCYAGAPNEQGETEGVGDNVYPQWLCSAGIPTSIGGSREQVVQKPWYKMAYSVDGVAQYGSILVTYNDAHPTSTNASGVYTVRTSGYSRFAGKFIPKDGTTGNLLAIYGIYSHNWSYQYATYQLSINRYKDFEFEAEPKAAYKEWSDYLIKVENNFPKYSLVPLTDDALHAEQVATWKAWYLANKPTMPADNDENAELLANWKKWNDWGDWVVWCLENTSKEAWLLPQYLTEDDDSE